jgi:hypothetical protein
MLQSSLSELVSDSVRATYTGKAAIVHASLLIKNALQSLAQSCQLFTLIPLRKQTVSMLLLLFFNLTYKTLMISSQLHFSQIKEDVF